MINEEKKIESNKKEDSRKFPLFIVICVAAGIVGVLLGYLIMFKREFLNNVFVYFSENTMVVSTVCGCLFLIVGTVLLIVTAVIYSNAKKLWDDEQNREDNWDKAEEKLTLAGTLTTVHTILIYVLYAMAAYNLAGNSFEVAKSFREGGNSFGFVYYILFAICTIGMFVFIFVNLGLQKRIVNQEKVMNPEKKGSVYDLKFRKKWMESMDEAELKQVGVAAYEAFFIVNRTCMIAFVVLALLGMMVKITLVPIVVLGVLWLVQNISFAVACRKNNAFLQ